MEPGVPLEAQGGIMLKFGQKVVCFYGTEIEKRIFEYLLGIRPETKVIIQFDDKTTKVVRLDELTWEGN